MHYYWKRVCVAITKEEVRGKNMSLSPPLARGGGTESLSGHLVYSTDTYILFGEIDVLSYHSPE